MSLTPEQIAQGWRLHDGSDVCPIKDDLAAHEVMFKGGALHAATGDPKQWQWMWVAAYRIIEAHGADAEPARPTPFPASYDELVWDTDGWSQTIIVDGKRPKWLRDDDWCCASTQPKSLRWLVSCWVPDELAIRVRRREPKRETVGCSIVPRNGGRHHFAYIPATIDLLDGKPDLSTLKIAEDAL